jgi:hypothetical protein
MGGMFSIIVKLMMTYYIYTLFRKMFFGEGADVSTVENRVDIDDLGAVNMTAESFAFYHVIKR